jgi:hypothetical protein
VVDGWTGLESRRTALRRRGRARAERERGSWANPGSLKEAGNNLVVSAYFNLKCLTAIYAK